MLFPNRGHVLSIDVDLALDGRKLPKHVYDTIWQRLKMKNYRPKDGAPNIFFRDLGGLPPLQVKLDLITGEGQDQAIQGIPVSGLRGIDLALEFSEEVKVSATLPDGAENTVTARIVSLPAFICIKAILLTERQKPKDAYDIYFCLKEYAGGPAELARRFDPLRTNPLFAEARATLAEKFKDERQIGPIWASQVVEENGGDSEFARLDAFKRAAAMLERL